MLIRCGALAFAVLCVACRCGPTTLKPACEDDAECGPTGACRNGGCITCSSCGPGTTCLRALCLPSMCGTRTCPSNQACIDGACRGADCVDVACGAGTGCGGGECLPTGCGAAVCAPGFVCPSGACISGDCVGVVCPQGQRCAGGQCLSTTCGAASCAASEVCVGTACVDAACIGVVCVAGFVCIAGACLETTADAGPPDAGPPDAGPPDAGPPDAGPADAGPDFQTTVFQSAPYQIHNSTNWTVVSKIDAVVNAKTDTVSLTVTQTASGTSMPLPIGTFSSSAQVYTLHADGGMTVLATDGQSRSPVWATIVDALSLPLLVGHYNVQADHDLWLDFDTTATNGLIENATLRWRSTPTDLTAMLRIDAGLAP